MGWGAVAAALLLAACDDAPKTPQGAGQTPPSEARAKAARAAAEDRLRARLRMEGPLTQRAVQVHRQALPDTLAVCGQINPSGRGEDPFIPYVAVVDFEGERPARTEFVLGASSAEAARVYLELLDRCFDGGGPTTTRASARPIPPIPSELPRPAPTPPMAPGAPLAIAPPVPAPGPALAAPASPATGAVTTTSRHPVNIRAHPSGGGTVLRVVPRGSTLQVFGEAPGGWLQVGEGEPWGWLHASLLEGR
jgi:hypothetical protein